MKEFFQRCYTKAKGTLSSPTLQRKCFIGIVMTTIALYPLGLFYLHIQILQHRIN